MKALVIGADGVIGSELARALTLRGDDVYSTTRRPQMQDARTIFFDLAHSNPDAVSLPAVDVAVFCAAIASFSECRLNRDLAYRINVSGAFRLAHKLVAAGAHVILLSTSAVFDWSTPNVPAEKPPCPSTIYGVLKAEAEHRFLALGNAASVVRFSKVLTPQFKLCLGWIDALGRGETISAFTDLCMAPIGLPNAIDAILAVLDKRAPGIFQLSASRDISYYEAALQIADRLGVPAERVRASLAIESGIPQEEITCFSTVDDSQLRRLAGLASPDPELVLDTVLAQAIDAALAKTR